MKKILVFAGSNSKTSINKRLAIFAGNAINDAEITVLDLNDFELPIYGVDIENQVGIPKEAIAFFKAIKSSDGIILSLAEHNGAYSAAFKNVFDWLSRIESQFWNNKPMLLMATSPGARGGQTVLDIAKDRFPRHKANIVATFSLPSFNDNFSDKGLKDATLNNLLNQSIITFKSNL